MEGEGEEGGGGTLEIFFLIFVYKEYFFGVIIESPKKFKQESETEINFQTLRLKVETFGWAFFFSSAKIQSICPSNRVPRRPRL